MDRGRRRLQLSGRQFRLQAHCRRLAAAREKRRRRGAVVPGPTTSEAAEDIAQRVNFQKSYIAGDEENSGSSSGSIRRRYETTIAYDAEIYRTATTATRTEEQEVYFQNSYIQ